MGDFEIVFFDLETTGFTRDDEIIQIAACNGNSFFNVYITPTRPIHWKASQVTGLELYNGHLYLHNKRIRTIPRKNAFNNFMNYLRRINKNIILVAHNCFGFDMPRIIALAGELRSLNQFQKIVHGFSDSLVILRSVLSERRVGKGKFTLKSLVQDYAVNISTNNLHNAKCDIEALQILLFEKLSISEDLVIQWSKSFDQYFYEQEIKQLVTDAKRSLQAYRNYLHTWIINKMAKTRINRAILRNVFRNNGFEGVQRLFSKNYYGRPRVTRNKKIISDVCNTIHNDLCGTL